MSESAPQQPQTQQDYDSFLYRFQQQIISAWKPVPRSSSNVILYSILTVVCLSMGLLLTLTAPTYPQINVEYSSLCALDPTLSTTYNPLCTFTFTLTQTLPAPIYMYYGLNGFYQNHRRYLKFMSDAQLTTGTLSASDVSACVMQAQTNCGNYVTNGQCGYTNNPAGGTLNPSDIAFPCGTIASAYYKIQKEIKGYVIRNPGGVTVPYTQTGIAYFSDVGRHLNYNLALQGVNVQDQTWLVWFRPAARNVFSKLNGVINQDMGPGVYTVTFLNHMNYAFGSKMWSLSKSNFTGSRDLFLGIAFLVLGTICLFLLIVFVAKVVNEKRAGAKID